MSFSWTNFASDMSLALSGRAALDVWLSAGLEAKPASSVEEAKADLMVGLGRSDQTDDRTIVLNNKVWLGSEGSRFHSISRLAVAMPAEMVLGTSMWHQRPMQPVDVLRRLRLLVEDASPDSILGVLLLLARIAGAEASDLPVDWIEAAESWELTGDAPDIDQSWAPLCSALAHSYFDPANAEGMYAPAPRRDVQTAWVECLLFTAHAIAARLNPNGIPPSFIGAERARAAIAAEEQSYRAMLDHAAIVQLNIPLADSPSRSVLVDGLFFAEHALGGVKKLFIRRDSENAPLKSGFGFMAVHRSAPSLVGTGNDITFSLDAKRGLTLEGLWRRLEDLEDHAWASAGENRPCDRPRKLAHPATWDRQGFDQPWYIDPLGTLVAAPRFIKQDGRGVPGSKLSWADACAAVWSLYNPARDIRILDASAGDRLSMLENCEPCETETDLDKRLFIARYAPPQASDGGDTEPPTVIYSQTVQRVVATMIRWGSRPSIEITRLEAPDYFEGVDLPGGYAIVSPHGCFLFDDWTSPPLNLALYRGQFRDAAGLLRALGEVREELALLRSDADEYVKNERSSRSTRLPTRMSQLRIRLAALRVQFATPPTDRAARRLRQVIDTWWGIDRSIDELQSQAKDIEESVRLLSAAREQRDLGLFARWGTPVFIGASLADPLQKAISKLVSGWTSPPSATRNCETAQGVADCLKQITEGLPTSWGVSDLLPIAAWFAAVGAVTLLVKIVWSLSSRRAARNDRA